MKILYNSFVHPLSITFLLIVKYFRKPIYIFLVKPKQHLPVSKGGKLFQITVLTGELPGITARLSGIPCYTHDKRAYVFRVSRIYLSRYFGSKTPA